MSLRIATVLAACLFAVRAASAFEPNVKVISMEAYDDAGREGSTDKGQYVTYEVMADDGSKTRYEAVATCEPGNHSTYAVRLYDEFDDIHDVEITPGGEPRAAFEEHYYALWDFACR